MMDKEEWLKRYKKRLIERGIEEKLAGETTKTLDMQRGLDFLNDDPEMSADDELSYWASDG